MYQMVVNLDPDFAIGYVNLGFFIHIILRHCFKWIKKI